MDQDVQERTRIRAYEVWERQGRSGDPMSHWLEAQRELGAECEQECGNASYEPLLPDWCELIEAVEATCRALVTRARQRRARLPSTLDEALPSYPGSESFRQGRLRPDL